jgi:hypothetical protein
MRDGDNPVARRAVLFPRPRPPRGGEFKLLH